MARIGDEGSVDMFANVLGCKVTKFPFKYLGVLLGAKYKDKISWDLVIDLFERRLSGGREISYQKGAGILY